MKYEGLRAAIDRVTHEALPLANATVQDASKARAQAQVDIADGILALLDGMGGEAGYVGAFFDIASIAGIGTAQTLSAREVYEQQLRPKLQAAFSSVTDEEVTWLLEHVRGLEGQDERFMVSPEEFKQADEDSERVKSIIGRLAKAQQRDAQA